MKRGRHSDTGSEFDRFASEYPDLLEDPIRDAFASDSRFFHLRKWALISGFFAARGVDTRNLRWLDVGCGTGELLRIGRDHFRDAAGCDPSSEMLSRAAGLRVTVQTDLLGLPFPNASFDFVTAVCVYHHIDPGDRRELTEAIREVLAPGGTFCLIEHNPLNPLTQLIVRRTPVDANAKLLHSRRAVTLCRAAGFEPIAVPYFLYLPEKIFSRFPHEEWLARFPFGGQYAVFARRP